MLAKDTRQFELGQRGYNEWSFSLLIQIKERMGDHRIINLVEKVYHKEL